MSDPAATQLAQFAAKARFEDIDVSELTALLLRRQRCR